MLCYIEVFFSHCIGSIGTASFYGGAAAARPHPRAQPGEFHVIVHLTINCSIGVAHLIHDIDMI